MAPQIAVRIPERYLTAVDEAVRAGRFPSRAAVVREALERLLAAEREREIADEYRRAYSQHPEEEWAGGVGEAPIAESIKDLEGDAGG
jgi:Arc/MetJ-type ribon-helix-helix transcriptional regulator